MAIITLTSDIGEQDFLTGAIKGKLFQELDSIQVVDITHKLSPFNYPQAAYVAGNAIRNFPVGTFHLVLVNLHDEKDEHILIAQHEGQYIGCADNGLLTMILDKMPEKVFAIPLDKTSQKNSLYCVSVLAKAFAQLLNGKTLEEIGNPVDIRVKNSLKPLLGNNYIEGQIIFIDHFENVIVNITRDEFEAQRIGRSFKIAFKRDEEIEKISETYADVPEGEKLALFNSAGYLEIAINKGNAAGLLGLQGYSEKHSAQSPQQLASKNLFYQTVKIHFE